MRSKFHNGLPKMTADEFAEAIDAAAKPNDLPPPTKMKIGTINPTPRTPTWGELQGMAQGVLQALGQRGIAEMNGEDYYTLAWLAALNVDQTARHEPITKR